MEGATPLSVLSNTIAQPLSLESRDQRRRGITQTDAGSYNTHVSAHHLSCRIMSCLDCCIEVAALRAPQHVARQAHDLLAASSTASFVNPKQSPQVLHPDPHSTWP
eukprot:scaffold103340_cov19-Tisochrysis_lutea.AAC.1